MEFTIVEGAYVDFDTIYDDFLNDYLTSGIPNRQLQKKYGLTKGEWAELTSLIKKREGLKRRPRNFDGKYYYKNPRGFQILKRIGDITYNFGTVPTEEIAQKVVKKCKEAAWDIDKCHDIVHNWKEII